MSRNGDRLRVLHVLLSIGETSAPYNEHCLPKMDERDLAVCTYFPPRITPPASLPVFAGNGSPPGFLRALARALAGPPWDVIHVHAPQAALVLLLTRLWARPVLRASSVYTVHNAFRNYKVRNRLLLIPVLASFGRIVCCSRVARESLPPALQRLAGRRLRVVPNGVDIARLDRVLGPRPDGAAGGAFTVASIGQLIERKDPWCVLRAFAAADDGRSRLLLVGGGHLRDPLADAVARRGLGGRVHITGLVPRESVYAHLGRADVFVSASRGEGLPVAVLEAMACRRPVVLSDIPSHREIAAGTEAIPLVPVGDVAGFAGELQRLRSLSPDARRAIGERCREVAESRFSLAAMHAGYEAVYAEVAGYSASNTRSSV